MIKRRKTTTVKAGSVRIGSRYPVLMQSMTKLATTDVSGCLKQIKALASAGAGLVRLAVASAADGKAFGRIVEKSSLPLVADIHFSPARAIDAIQAGAVKIRLNPGNITNRADILRIIDCAKSNGTAIRVGINEASIRNLHSDTPPKKRNNLMLKEMAGYLRLFEGRKFSNIVLSVKSSDVNRTIDSNIALAERFSYPLHLGLTHAGLAEDAIIPASAALGALLHRGIGDTVRISIAGNPVEEILVAKRLLHSLGLYPTAQPELIVCPTCGRCSWDLISFANRIRKVLYSQSKPLRVAVMGCVVNGPGEAADADIAVCAGSGKGFVYRNGQKIATLPQNRLFSAVKKEILDA